ncbi:hypothetical protein [Nocardia cyriacigeorgica]|uniref:hypothetical protein n=1 Tax=Nocardia cyriacigeorgica TaxID=135487 RepID=UPI000CE9E7AC|nr:hypothetical protein [Nocardia cyriacigeorgica]AVH21364.1 hypothetical protein C5B73_07705 [Nocardia cyriacigeorgica]MBF6100991.1 hypothetical protein [Nocardia cyriacigeorgica]MBF6162857.1 hypothetical protein [Nocardia cyriacigeorgica]MBF6201843.1 hypothetical protein [Nocardia cyriacigeorgica]MBF6315409.1 hypothetical protein [Nocardia cyriacigeorgica]
MAEGGIDYGQTQIAAFNAAAAAGTIRYEEGVARDAAAQYDNMIDGLYAIKERLRHATEHTSFGGLESAKQLQQGFAAKAVDGMEVIDKLIEGAMRLKEAYLRAGNLITDADAQNAATTRFVAQINSLGGSQQ